MTNEAPQQAVEVGTEVNSEVNTEATTSEQVTSTDAGLLDTAQSESTQAEQVTTEETSDVAFVDSLKDELKSVKSLHKFKSNDDLAQAYVNLEKQFGKRIDELPNEELVKLYTKLGAPESKDGYEFTPAELPEGVQDVLTDKFAEKAHELGLPKAAAQQLRDWYLEQSSAELKEQQTIIQDQVNQYKEELKQEFGSAYDQRIDAAKAIANEIGGEDLINEITTPAMVKAFAKIATMLGEDTVKGKSVDSTQFGTTPGEATEAIASLYNDPAFMAQWKNQSDPGHKAAVEKINRLYRIKAGQPAE